MPSLYNTTSDNSRPIATLDELRAALPAMPVIPSIWSLDEVPGFITQIIYGSPDRDHAEVKVITADGIERETFDRFVTATDRFLAIARKAFN